jgi:hypothetical protein
MEKRDSAQGSQLDITMLLRPVGTRLDSLQLTRNAPWKDVCEKVYRDLRSYLMGRGG